MKLSDIPTGHSAVVVKVLGSGHFRKRIIEMGFVRGKQVEVLLNAPLQDPVKYRVMDYEVSLRHREADLIEVISQEEAAILRVHSYRQQGILDDETDPMQHLALQKRHHINVALVGNPNCGKTSLFNLASGAHEHVGNYSGVTVDAKEGRFTYKDYEFSLFDLPGTYSLSAYSPEEIYVRKQIFEATPDLIINIVSASSLERNLYLTTQLIDMDIPMVIALNMYDELTKSGAKFDYQALGKMLGCPIIPTVAREGFTADSGVGELFDTAIRVYEHTEPTIRHTHISHGGELQEAIDHLNKLIKQADNYHCNVSSRFFATKLLEKDKEAEAFIQELSNADAIFAFRDKVVPHLEAELSEDCESAIINAKYGFIAGALTETYQEGKKEVFQTTRILDPIVTNRWLGFPIFLLFMWLMFYCTFIVGQYPMDWIGTFVDWIAAKANGLLAEGPLKDLLINGIIQGVGSVLVFMPNILIMYFFISLMEDSGYLSRAAFVMDRIMHKFGLHGKSFVPMLMGFGCNVPAVMATRTLESRNSRLITMLVIPFMSCSARLPIYLLFSGVFFPEHASILMLGLYILGLLVSMLSARLLRRFFIKGEDVPFVMELPPYRVPTLRSALHHMWEKSKQYLRKMGTVILFASIIIWALGYFPHHEGYNKQQQLEHSCIGYIGKAIEPLLRPLGFDWRMSVAVVTALPAKEIAVSSLNLLYVGEEQDEAAFATALRSTTTTDGQGITPVTAFCFMLFMLLCFPCIATIVAIRHESGSWKWALFASVYTTTLAWVLTFLCRYLLLCY